jgi:hypothetical protein
MYTVYIYIYTRVIKSIFFYIKWYSLVENFIFGLVFEWLNWDGQTFKNWTQICPDIKWFRDSDGHCTLFVQNTSGQLNNVNAGGGGEGGNIIYYRHFPINCSALGRNSCFWSETSVCLYSSGSFHMGGKNLSYFKQTTTLDNNWLLICTSSLRLWFKDIFETWTVEILPFRAWVKGLGIK